MKIFAKFLFVLALASLTSTASPLFHVESTAFAQTGTATQNGTTTADLELPKLQLVRELPRPGNTFGVLWSSDGSKLAAYTYSPGTILVANPYGKLVTIWTADGQIYRELTRPTVFFGISDTLAFAADNRKIVTPPQFTSNDLAFSVFDIASGELVHEEPGNNPGRGRTLNGGKVILASPDQTIIAVTFGQAYPQPVTLYSTRDWSKLAVLPEGAASLAFSPDGKLLAAARTAGDILLYDLSTKSIIRKFDAFPDIGGSIRTIAFSPDGQLIAAGTAAIPGTERDVHTFQMRKIVIRDPVRVFHSKDGSLAEAYSKSTDRIYALAWSPTRRYLAFITEHSKLYLWDPMNPNGGERTIDLNAGADSLAFSPDGHELAVGNGHVVSIFGPAP